MSVGVLPGLALVFNAFAWGTAWWPFRHLQGHGLHPLWATAMVFSLASLVIVAARPQSLRQVLSTPAGWLRIGLGVAGAVVVLWPSAGAGAVSPDDGPGAWPVPNSLADWLGVIGGLSFAFNNVMLRREAHRPEAGRALAMFLGGALVAAALATLLSATGRAPLPPALAAAWVWPLAGLTLLFLVGNLALQYGAARLPANRTSVVMLTEVVFASASAIALGAGTLTGRLAIGGSLIIAGALLAAVRPGPGP